jgi:mannosyltransferase OCH1-like enzyme
MFWDQKSIEILIDSIEDKELLWIKETYYFFNLIIQKIDFAKYVILYFYGGIYLDFDIKCIKTLDNILESEDARKKEIILSALTYEFTHRIFMYISGHYDTKSLVNNGVMMAIPRHEFIYKLMKLVNIHKNNSFRHINNFFYIFNSTGPVIVSKCLYNHIKDNNGDDIYVLDQSYFEACDIYKVKNNCILPENAVGSHIYENSWSTDREKRLIDIYYKYIKEKYIRSIIIIVLIIIIIYMMIIRKK